MWSPEAVRFLRELQANNDREWFKANRQRYDSELVRPAHELAGKLRHLGEARILRPYRDTRFRPGPPIREQLAITVAAPTGSYLVELSLDGLMVGAGLHHAFPISSSASERPSTTISAPPPSKTPWGRRRELGSRRSSRR